VSDHLSEEEQIERLKRWWAEQGKGVIAALILVVGSYGGWTFYQSSVEKVAIASSAQYQLLSDRLASTEMGAPLDATSASELAVMAEALKSSAADSQYGRYAALLLARIAVERDDLTTAETELRWVLASESDAGLSAATTLRLARVLAAQDRFDEALALIRSSEVDAFAGAYAELRGDLYRSQGNDAQAYSAYQAALDAGVDQRSTALLELKLNAVAAAVVELPSVEEQEQQQ